MLSGTGLTHKASAEDRSAMHKQSPAEVTDGLRMYRSGLEGRALPPVRSECNRNGSTRVTAPFCAPTKILPFPRLPMTAGNRRLRVPIAFQPRVTLIAWA